MSAASIYAVKMSVLDARGGVVKSETRKIALTR